MGETETLTKYIAQATYEDLPENVVDHAKKILLDSIGCGLGGRKSIDADLLIEIMKELDGSGDSTVIGDRTKLSLIKAAQVNSVLINILDYDETLVRIGHMSAVLVPVALAIGERLRAPGEEVINALVLGYEFIIRLRRAIEPSEAVFWKTFERIGSGIHLGATIVAGKLLRLDGGQMADAIGLTGHLSPTRLTMPDVEKKGMPRWMKVTQGDLVVPGIQAAFLAQKGFPGDRSMFDQGKGYERFVGSDQYDATRLTDGLGDEYGMLRIGYKFYPACRHISATLDAIAAIKSRHTIKLEDIQQIMVSAQTWVAKEFAIYGPEHMIQAEFSIPYTASMVLMGEPPGPNWFTPAMLRDPRALELQNKIKVKEDPLITQKYYQENKYASIVEISTTDGHCFREYVECPKGDPETPFSQQDHINKFSSMAYWLGIGQDQVEELLGVLNRFERLKDVRRLTFLLVPRN